jgi:hypothetical protein
MELNEAQPNAISRIEGQDQSRAAGDETALLSEAPLPVDEEPHLLGRWVGTNTSTLSAIERLKMTIDEETQKLEIRAPVDFDGFSQRKNRGLLELTRAMRLAQGDGLDPRVAPYLTSLRSSLIRNQAALQIHLDAVREVSAIIARSIQEVESDGTYSLAGSSRPK